MAAPTVCYSSQNDHLGNDNLRKPPQDIIGLTQKRQPTISTRIGRLPRPSIARPTGGCRRAIRIKNEAYRFCDSPTGDNGNCFTALALFYSSLRIFTDGRAMLAPTVCYSSQNDHLGNDNLRKPPQDIIGLAQKRQPPISTRIGRAPSTGRAMLAPTRLFRVIESAGAKEITYNLTGRADAVTTTRSVATKGKNGD